MKRFMRNSRRSARAGSRAPGRRSAEIVPGRPWAHSLRCVWPGACASAAFPAQPRRRTSHGYVRVWYAHHPASYAICLSLQWIVCRSNSDLRLQNGRWRRCDKRETFVWPNWLVRRKYRDLAEVRRRGRPLVGESFSLLLVLIVAPIRPLGRAGGGKPRTVMQRKTGIPDGGR